MSEPHAQHTKLLEAPHHPLGPTMQPPTVSRQRRCIARTSYGGLFTRTHSRILARVMTYFPVQRRAPGESGGSTADKSPNSVFLLSYSRVLRVHSLLFPPAISTFTVYLNASACCLISPSPSILPVSHLIHFPSVPNIHFVPSTFYNIHSYRIPTAARILRTLQTLRNPCLSFFVYCPSLSDHTK